MRTREKNKISEHYQGSDVNGMGQKSPCITLDAGVESQILDDLVSSREWI